MEEATAAKKRLSEQFSKKYDQIKEKNTNIELSVGIFVIDLSLLFIHL